MACSCNSPFQSPWACPDQTDPFGLAPENPLKVVVLDTQTNQVRELLPHETPPKFPNCGTSCGPNIGQLPTSKVMQDAYLELVTRLRALEEKYCNCICGDPAPAPEPTPVPTPEPVEQVPDSWRTNVIEPEIPSPLDAYGILVDIPKDYDLVSIKIAVKCDSYLEGDFGFDYSAAMQSLGNSATVMLYHTNKVTNWEEYNESEDTYNDRTTVTFDVTLASPVQGTPLSSYLGNDVTQIRIGTRSYMYGITRVQVLVTADRRELIESSINLYSPA